MKKLKYIKLFEAFESVKLSKTLGFIKDKEKFLSILKEIANSIDLPYSKFSDDYFQYLPFKKALELNRTIDDEPCEATSKDAFPQYSIEGEKCVDGRIKRKWGDRIRTVTCPVCNGTGVKPKKYNEIKWIKFWFTNEGKYVATTATDGKIRYLGEVEKETDDVDPYSWNALYRNGRIFNDHTKEILNPAHFGIILDILDLKKSDYKKRVEIRSEREEEKRGALAFTKDSDIKRINIERYIEELSKRLEIPTDLKDFNKVFLKYLGGSKIGYFVLRGRNYSDFNSFINYFYELLSTENEERKESLYNYLLRDLKSKFRGNLHFNNSVNTDLENTYNSISEEKSSILKKLEELNKTIFEKVKETKIDNLDDVEILLEKFSSIRNIWRNSERFQYSRKLYYGVENLGDVVRFKRYLDQIEDNQIEKVINDFDRLINLVKKF